MHILQPVLDAVCDVTGWKTTLIAGGPDPAQNGQLSVIRYVYSHVQASYSNASII